eukprot:scaffold7579_cov137-Isochrysis_galbana.AAC.4
MAPTQPRMGCAEKTLSRISAWKNKIEFPRTASFAKAIFVWPYMADAAPPQTACPRIALAASG